MKTRRIAALLIALVMVFSIASYGATAFAADAKKPTYKLVFTTGVSTASPETQGFIYLGEILEERSGGRFKTEVFPDGTLGGETEWIDQVRSNAITGGTSAWVTFDNFAKEYTPWVVPYLYSSTEQIQRSWEGRTGDAMREGFANNGLYCYELIFRGNRQLTSNVLVETPEDLKGLKLRLPNTAAWVTVWSYLGAMPTTISTNEVFSALQTGVVDAQENPIISNWQKGLAEVQDYTIMTNHIVDFVAYFFSKTFVDGLDEEDRAMFEEAVIDATAYAQKLYDEQQAQAIDEMKAAGMEFIEIDTTLFKEASAGALDEIKGTWADWVYDEALKDSAA